MTGSLIGMRESEMVLAFLLGKESATYHDIGFVPGMGLYMQYGEYGDNTVIPSGVSG